MQQRELGRSVGFRRLEISGFLRLSHFEYEYRFTEYEYDFGIDRFVV